MSYVSQIVGHIKKAQEIAAQHGYKILLLSGLLKELIIGDLLGHEVHRTKHEPDAWDPKNPALKFEYLSCFEKGKFQLDRMFKSPPEKRAKSLERVTRNAAIYCAVFAEANPLTVLVIYKLPVEVVLQEIERQLDASSNDISHIGLTIKWCERQGEVVYKKDS